MEENDYYGSSYGTHSYSSFVQVLDRTKEDVPTGVLRPDGVPDGARLVSLRREPDIVDSCSYELFMEDKEMEEDLVKNSRRYNIDLSHNLLWCRGEDVANMVVSGTHRYIEFHCIKQSLIVDGEKIIPAPVTKKDIFRSKDISLVEKRSLMRFVQNVMKLLEPVDTETNVYEEGNSIPQSNSTFMEYMAEQKLSENLQKFILYIVCLSTSEEGKITYINLNI